MNALAEIKRLPENKAQQETFVNAVIGELLAGNEPPINIDVRLKIIEDTIKKIRNDVRIKNLILDEVHNYGNEDILVHGVAVKLKTRRSADFSNDNEWLALKAKLKAREAELKALGHIPDTGEELLYKHSEFIEMKY